MTTLEDIVNDAYHSSNIVEVNASPTAEELTTGLNILNRIIFGMELDCYVFTLPIVLPATERGAYTHVAWILADEWPFEEGYVEGVIAMVSERLSELHGSPPPPFIKELAGVGYSRLTSAFFVMPTNRAPIELQRLGRSGMATQTRNYIGG